MGCGSQPYDVLGLPWCQPRLQFRDVDAVDRRRIRTFPQGLVPCHRRDEVEPPIAGVKREHTSGPLAVGQIEVFAVGAKRISSIAASRHRDRCSCADQDDGVSRPQRAHGASAALQRGGDFCQRVRWRHRGGS